MRKIPLIAGALAILTVFTASGVSAFFTDRVSVATGLIVNGNPDITLSESEFSQAKANGVMPGDYVKKNPAVKNSGSKDRYVFAQVKVPTVNAKGVATPLFSYAVNENWTLLSSYYEGVYKNEVFFYGKNEAKILESGMSTENLFPGVSIDNPNGDDEISERELHLAVETFAARADTVSEKTKDKTPAVLWKLILNDKNEDYVAYSLADNKFTVGKIVLENTENEDKNLEEKDGPNVGEGNENEDKNPGIKDQDGSGNGSGNGSGDLNGAQGSGNGSGNGGGDLNGAQGSGNGSDNQIGQPGNGSQGGNLNGSQNGQNGSGNQNGTNGSLNSPSGVGNQNGTNGSQAGQNGYGSQSGAGGNNSDANPNGTDNGLTGSTQENNGAGNDAGNGNNGAGNDAGNGNTGGGPQDNMGGEGDNQGEDIIPIIPDKTVEVVEDFPTPAPLIKGSNVHRKTVSAKNLAPYAKTLSIGVGYSNAFMADHSFFSVDEGLSFVSLSELKENPPQGWTYVEGGVFGGRFVYNTPINPGESTPPLFTHTKCVFENASDIINFDILIFAMAERSEVI